MRLKMILFMPLLMTLWPTILLPVHAEDLPSLTQSDSDVVCASKKCINKCCPPRNIMQCEFTGITDCNCIETDEDLDFSVIPLTSDGDKVDTKFNDAFFILFSKRLNVINDTSFLLGSVLSSMLPVPVYLGVDGMIRLKNVNAYEQWTSFDTDKYCLDFKKNNETLVYDFVIKLQDDEQETDNPVYIIAMFISIFFLVVVFIVYAILPNLKNLPGKILMAYVFTQIVPFLSLCILQVGDNPLPEGCVALSGIIYYGFLSSFCWMNVMSYDIFWTFRSYAKAREHRRGEMFKFYMYSMYAWGLPLALTIMMIMMDSTDFSDKPWIIKPLINERGCFLREGQKFVYLYIPMLILIVCNWIFFLLTVFNIWRLNRGTAVLHSPASGNAAAHRAHKMRFFVYIKLSVVMGVNWILEVVSSFYPKLSGWWITDLYNILIGLVIFILFVCKKKIYNDLVDKYQPVFSRIGLRRQSTINSSTMNSTTDSSLSQDISLQVSSHPRGSGYSKESEKNV